MVVSGNPRFKISSSLIKYVENKCSCKSVVIMRYIWKRDNTAASFCVCTHLHAYVRAHVGANVCVNERERERCLEKHFCDQLCCQSSFQRKKRIMAIK